MGSRRIGRRSTRLSRGETIQMPADRIYFTATRVASAGTVSCAQVQAPEPTASNVVPSAEEVIESADAQLLVIESLDNHVTPPS